MIPPSTKLIVICADDYSLNPAINAGILSLLAQKRLSAVSCMTQSPTWHSDAKALLPWRSSADLGLHFNLTHPFPDSWHSPLPQLMLQSTVRGLPAAKIRASLCTQLDAFENAIGSAPDFIDGHQHVHIFPQVRAVLIDEYLRRYPNRLPYVRSLAVMAGDNDLKARVLRAMGAKALDRQLAQYGIPRNTAFAGLYSLEADTGWPERMRHWLTVLPAGGLLMCHPADALTDNDCVAAARLEEYRYLSNPDWLQLLADCRVQIGKLSTLR